MRLLVVSQYFWPENFRINDLVAEFVKRGHQVTVLTGLPNYPDGKVFPEFQGNSAKFQEYEGARIVRVPMMPRGQGGLRLILNYFTFAVSASFWGLWKLRGEKFDVIFAYEPSPITVGLPAALLRAVKHAPLVFWVLDLWPETLHAIGVIRSKTALRIVGKLVAFIYKRCDLILAQSRSFMPEIYKYAGRNRCVYYFPSWAESVFDVQNAESATEVSLQSEGFTVVFAGNIGDAQDFPAILAAAEKLKPFQGIRWLIVGDGRMAEWVRNEIKQRKLQECVHMLGRFPVERMPSFFKHADALLVSLKDESVFSMTIPGKLQSYLAAGIPVIAMLNGEGADVVESSGAGVVCSAGDPDGLASAVIKLMKMTNTERATLGQNGLNVATRDFSRDVLISRLEQWLIDLSTNTKLPSVSPV
ncbi:MAG: glycosyltransferase WbuB [Burkholderiales bacterium RIFCSPLOWO2_12_FULL_61_40]|nr:MAG: glycosyltransferase WbuB [Burkholderiales bacterium RIFCSPLOWO2_12_FULL_61_40]